MMPKNDPRRWLELDNFAPKCAEPGFILVPRTELDRPFRNLPGADENALLRQPLIIVVDVYEAIKYRFYRAFDHYVDCKMNNCHILSVLC